MITQRRSQVEKKIEFILELNKVIKTASTGDYDRKLKEYMVGQLPEEMRCLATEIFSILQKTKEYQEKSDIGKTVMMARTTTHIRDKHVQLQEIVKKSSIAMFALLEAEKNQN